MQIKLTLGGCERVSCQLSVTYKALGEKKNRPSLGILENLAIYWLLDERLKAAEMYSLLPLRKYYHYQSFSHLQKQAIQQVSRKLGNCGGGGGGKVGRRDLKSAAQENDSSHESRYVYIRMTVVHYTRWKRRPATELMWIFNLSVWSRHQRPPTRCHLPLYITCLCLIPSVTPRTTPQIHCLNTHQHLWVSEQPKTVSESLPT